MKVRANENFKHYRNAVLKLDKRLFRKLQGGGVCDIPDAKYKERPSIYDLLEKKAIEEKEE